MKIMNRSGAVTVLSLGLAMVTAAPVPAMAGWDHHDRMRDYDDLRGLIDRTQSDLRASIDLQHGKKQDERYRNAQDHLSAFDRSLSKGKFDKDRLDTAIGDIQHILDGNTLQSRDRDALKNDVDELRMARTRHDSNH